MNLDSPSTKMALSDLERPKILMSKLPNRVNKSKMKAMIFIPGMALLTLATAPLQPANAAGTQVVTVLDVNFESAPVNGTTITNSAAAKEGDLTINGSPTGLGTINGISFPNSISGATTNYLTGNLGSTTYTTKIEVEISALFPDDGCAASFNGSMVFGLGDTISLTPYNIYRHSGFIGFNTFNSDLYGIELPDTTNFHTYKFVMVPNGSAATSQEIWVDGVKQTLSYKTKPGSNCGGVPSNLIAAESVANRVFKTPNYSNGAFTLMTHPLDLNSWGTTGTLKSVKVTTTNVYEVPSAPSITAITSVDGKLSVEFTAPTFNGGTDITDYKYSTDGGISWLSSGSASSPISISGLTGGETYSIILKAVNIAGESSASEPSSATVEKIIDPVEPLAETGSGVLSTGLVAAVLLVAGFVLLLISRRTLKTSKH